MWPWFLASIKGRHACISGKREDGLEVGWGILRGRGARLAEDRVAMRPSLLASMGRDAPAEVAEAAKAATTVT